ncbi:MAG: TusE/DsrC/DsvC family sulfur relay protein [Acidiferrobacter sp.]
MGIEVKGIHIPLDDEGYLVDPTDWNELIGEALADTEDIVLTADHWHVIYYVRHFFEEHEVVPDARLVIKNLAERGSGTAARSRLFELFPYGYVKQTCKIAGMRRPRAWSTG